MRHILHTPALLAAIPTAFLLMTVTALTLPTGAQQKDPSLLHIGKSLSSVKTTEIVPTQRLVPRMHWGAKDSSGLQLGAYYDTQGHHFLCLIRNAGAHAVTMNAYQFGCGGYIKVYARIVGTTQWTEVNEGACAHGVGPSARDNVIVQPGQYLIGENLVFGNGAEHRTITRIECSFSTMGALNRLPNPDRKPVEFRVEHKLPNDGSPDVWQGTLSSPILTVPAKLLLPQSAEAPANRP